MALDMTSPRSRRALLAGALGALGSAAAATVTGAQRVLAAGSDGETVVIGATIRTCAPRRRSRRPTPTPATSPESRAAPTSREAAWRPAEGPPSHAET